MSAQIIDFPPAQQAVASENALAAEWHDAWFLWFDFTLDLIQQTQHAYVAIMDHILYMERREEAKETGRLIRELFEDVHEA